MKLYILILCFIISSYGFFALGSEVDRGDNQADQVIESKSADSDAMYYNSDEISDPFYNSPGMGGGMGRGMPSGGGRGGWGGNPFKWSSGPRTWYNPFSWGNQPATTVVVPVTTPTTNPDDDLDAQINQANIRAKKLEFLLAKQKQIQALEELNKNQNPPSPPPSP